MEPGERWTIGEDNDVFVIGSGDCVAKVCGAPEGIKKSKGRARLIAAAPKMLSRLQGILTDLEDFLNEDGEFEWTPEAGRKICREIEKTVQEATS